MSIFAEATGLRNVPPSVKSKVNREPLACAVPYNMQRFLTRTVLECPASVPASTRSNYEVSGSAGCNGMSRGAGDHGRRAATVEGADGRQEAQQRPGGGRFRRPLGADFWSVHHLRHRLSAGARGADR